MAICRLKDNVCNYCFPGPCPHREDEADDN